MASKRMHKGSNEDPPARCKFWGFSGPLKYITLCKQQCFDSVGWAAGRASGLQKTELWGAGMVIRLGLGADLHMAQLMPLPLTVSCFSKIQIGFAFLVPAHPGGPGKRAFKRVCVCVSSKPCSSMGVQTLSAGDSTSWQNCSFRMDSPIVGVTSVAAMRPFVKNSLTTCLL